MPEPLHYLPPRGAAPHAVPDAFTASFTTTAAAVTCPICLRTLGIEREGRG